MKKVFLFLFLFLVFDEQALAASFPDVAEDHKNYKAIEYLDEKQIINGYSDGSFGPDKLVNRAEALKMIIGALKISMDGNYEVLFPDVKKEDWFFPYVMAAKSSGIAAGYKDGKFRPADTVNLAENLKMLLLAAKMEIPGEGEDNIFQDVKKSDWFAPHVLYARNHNLIFSDDYGFVHPDQAMTRATFAELVYRVMIVLERKGEPFPLDMSWPLYESKKLPFKMKYDAKAWKVFENKESVIFMRPDKQYSQFSPFRIYPNSAVVTVTLDINAGEMVADQYFTNIKKAFPEAKNKKFKLGGLVALEILNESKRTVDWYIYLKNTDVLVIYTEYGYGPLGFQLRQIIKAMLVSFEYKELPASNEDYSVILNKILGNVLVKGKGMDMLNTLPEKLIIQTDTIGAGNGPVDYYFSEKVNYTFKYERDDDVILDSREGKTTTF